MDNRKDDPSSSSHFLERWTKYINMTNSFILAFIALFGAIILTVEEFSAKFCRLTTWFGFCIESEESRVKRRDCLPSLTGREYEECAK